MKSMETSRKAKSVLYYNQSDPFFEDTHIGQLFKRSNDSVLTGIIVERLTKEDKEYGVIRVRSMLRPKNIFSICLKKKYT